MVAALRLLAVAVLVTVLGGTASAGKLVVADVTSEPDFDDEANAITLLVRSALVGDDRVLVDAPAGITVGGAIGVLEKEGAEHAILMDLGRDGLKLRLTVVIIPLKQPLTAKVFRAGDGDVVTLAREAVDHVTTNLRLMKSRVHEVSLGRLRPFAAALRLRTSDPAAAARALLDASPNVALSMSAIPRLLAGVPAAAADPVTGAIAARVLRDVDYLDKLGGDTTPSGAAARALSALARNDPDLALAELGPKPPKTGITTLIRAIAAEIGGDAKVLEARIVEGLSSDQPRAVLAFAASVGTFSKATHAALVGAAEKVAPEAPGVISLIGLAAAEAEVEVPRALALISARELDDMALKRLEPLVKDGADPTSLRLRAEIALRRADDDRAAVAINTFASEAPDDLRSARYHAWLLASKGKYDEAATQLATGGFRRERARALAAADEYSAARAIVEGAPTTAEELVLAAEEALTAGNLVEAERLLLRAEQAAPASPIVQDKMVQLGTKQNNPERVRRARLLVGDDKKHSPDDKTVIVSGTGTQKRVSTAPQKVVIDLQGVDPRVLEPMLEALGLAQHARKKLAIVHLGWSPSLFSFRKTQPDLVRDALLKLVSAPPYEVQALLEPRTFEGESLPLDTLVKLTADLDGALVYRVEPAGSDARITLLLYKAGSTQATQVTRVVEMAGVVTFNTVKLGVIIGFVLVLGLVGGLWFTRGMGRIELQIARAADSDEALCVEVTKNPKRPIIGDMLAFHKDTKAAGTRTKARTATLIASGHTMRVPTGHWYVHLYGTYARGGKLRLVPDSCTQHIDIRRGALVEVSFDLLAKGAEVTVEVVYKHPDQVVVWANEETARRKLDAEGKVEMLLPVGHHTISIKTATDTLELPLDVPTPRAIRMSVNVARELRLMRDLELGVDTEKAAELEIELSHPGIKRSAIEAVLADPRGQTQAASADSNLSLSGTPAKAARASIPVPGEMLLDRYKITAELGRGAMGIVQRAWDTKLEREVAIKLMADDLRAIPEAMALFTSEARALAQLNHTNIVSMYDQITDDDKVYMIMEYVDGETLEGILTARGSMPWFEAIGVIDQVCSGLAYAHARKVIHRDIKPANIFVANDKTVKLGDFGLARVMREVTIRRTEVRGTPLYMAPEQITGTDVDHRSDLYAIGCTLFELVCGRPPFVEGDILYAQMNSPPPQPSSLVQGGLPSKVDELILTLLAKDPDDRPGSANEVRTTLRELSIPF